jgi:hypothetical protein
MDGGDASHAFISHNIIRNAGRLEAGQIAELMIPKYHPHGIFIYQPGGDIRIEENLVEFPLECGVCIYSHPDGDFKGLQVSGGEFRGVGESAGLGVNANQYNAVFRRSGSAKRKVSNFSARNVRIQDSHHSLLVWASTGEANEEGVEITNASLVGCDLRPDTPLVRLSGRGSGVPNDVRVSVNARHSQIPSKLAATAQALSAAPQIDVEIS